MTPNTNTTWELDRLVQWWAAYWRAVVAALERHD